MWRMLRHIVVQRLALALVLCPLVAACAGTGGPDLASSDAASPSAAPAVTSVREGPPRSGPVGDSGATASCVEAYSATTIGNRDFAFDGTVVAVAAGASSAPGQGGLDTAAVTFRVNEWFKGGTDDTVSVDMAAPTNSVGQDQVPSYEQGTRLLVSGEPRWGGEPLDDPIAWTCGGFTRYYEEAVAEEWRGATG